MTNYQAAVIDSNIALMSILKTPATSQCVRVMEHLQSNRKRLFAPRLLWYEVTSLIHRYLSDGLITAKLADEVFLTVLDMAINPVEEDDTLCRSAFNWASRIGQKTAHEGFYLAVSEKLGAEFWTADKRLKGQAVQLGLRRVHWIGDLD